MSRASEYDDYDERALAEWRLRSLWSQRGENGRFTAVAAILARWIPETNPEAFWVAQLMRQSAARAASTAEPTPAPTTAPHSRHRRTRTLSSRENVIVLAERVARRRGEG